MIFHNLLGIPSFATSRTLYRLIQKKEIQLAGNAKLKIYGRLDCNSGRRMKHSNRVFFTSEKEAIDFGYRPCAHCMRLQYKQWKQNDI